MDLNVLNTEAFDQFVKKTINEWHVPGLGIAIIQGNEINAKGYGLACLPDKPFTENTLFDCASTSKSFTSAAIALLIDDGNYPDVKWDTPVSKLLREDFVFPDPVTTDQVTIEDILSHRTGMPRHDLASIGQKAEVPDTPRSVVRKLRYLPVIKPLRTSFNYSNLLYTTASYLVEALSKQPFEEFIRERFWDPLGMENTFLGSKDAREAGLEDQMAHAYLWRKESSEYTHVDWMVEPEAQGSGSIFTSVSQWAKWMRAMINKAEPLSESAHEELVKPRILASTKALPNSSHLLYALGWEVEWYRGYQIIEHDGYTSGFGSLMRFIPEKNWGIVVHGNSSGGNEAAAIITGHLIHELLGIPEVDRTDWNKFYRDQEAEDNKEDEKKKKPFPELTTDPLPTLVSLEAHIGTYSHPAYGDLTFQIRDGKLFADGRDRTFGYTIELTHHSGEYFVARLNEMADVGVDEDWIQYLQAEFKVDPSSVVLEFGTKIEELLPDGELIWFKRVEEGKNLAVRSAS